MPGSLCPIKLGVFSLQAETHRKQGLARVAGQGADLPRGVERGPVEQGMAGTADDGGIDHLAAVRQDQQQDGFAFKTLRHG